MTAPRRRLIAKELCEDFHVSQRRASRALDLARSSLRYEPVLGDEQAAFVSFGQKGYHFFGPVGTSSAVAGRSAPARGAVVWGRNGVGLAPTDGAPDLRGWQVVLRTVVVVRPGDAGRPSGPPGLDLACRPVGLRQAPFAALSPRDLMVKLPA